MTITQVKITDEELNQAVGDWLTKRGVSVPVKSVEKAYAHHRHFEVEFADPVAPVELSPLPAPTPVPTELEGIIPQGQDF